MKEEKEMIFKDCRMRINPDRILFFLEPLSTYGVPEGKADVVLFLPDPKNKTVKPMLKTKDEIQELESGSYEMLIDKGLAHYYGYDGPPRDSKEEEWIKNCMNPRWKLTYILK